MGGHSRGLETIVKNLSKMKFIHNPEILGGIEIFPLQAFSQNGYIIENILNQSCTK